MSIFKELKRRNVIRVAIAYAVVSWLVLQVANTLVPVLELSPSVTKTVLLILLLGFIPAMFFSWAFEITPEGVKKEKDVARDESVTNLTAKKLDYVTLVAAVGVLGLFVYQQMRPPVSTPVSKEVIEQSSQDAPTTVKESDLSEIKAASIAVLPFVNMSSDKEQEYFADGISEEILNALVKAKGLRVAGRTSSFSFKGKDDTIKQIGDALKVAHVLEGSVRKQGNQVRITAQLIKTDDEFHLWSETYDGTLDNIFDLQEDISRQVTEELKIILELNADERLASKMTSDIDAYDLFLRGRDHVGKRVRDNIPKGIVLLEQAVKLDPEFAEAWALLAEAEMVSSSYTEADAASSDARAKRHAEKALQLNERLALPHAVLAFLTANEKNYTKAIEEFDKALVLEPENPIVLRWLGNMYSIAALHDKAQALYKKAFTLNPLSTADAFNLGAINFKLHNYNEAIRYYQLSGELRSSKVMLTPT